MLDEISKIPNNIAAATSKTQLTIHRPFGPSIAKVKLPKILIEKFNSYIDSELEKQNTSIDFGPYLASNVTQELRIEDSFVETSGLLKFLASSTQQWIHKINGKEISKFELLSCWAVRQFENEYNPAHYHGGHISGVGYLKLPETFGDNIQETKSGNLNGNIQFIHGSHQFLSGAVMAAKPELGDFYLFPNYLMHTVYPFFGDGERRSISFNAVIDNEIYGNQH